MRSFLPALRSVSVSALQALAGAVVLFALLLMHTTVQARDDVDTRVLREAVRSGRVVPLERILEDALRRVPGRVVDVEVDLEDDEYEIEILDARGRVWELEYRASTGELIEIEED